VSLFAPLAEISLPKVTGREQVSALVGEHVLPWLPANAGLISVDGLDGSGKSEIGRAIANLSNRALINVDDFLEEQQDRFLDALRIDDLRRALAVDKPAVLEGCLVGAVLQKISKKADFKIYVARTGRMTADPQHEWCDEHELLFGTRAASDLIAEEERNLSAFCKSGLFGRDSSSDPDLCGLRKELISYHRNYLPHKRADLIVKVVRQL
jgi:hypothetical protein